jgi:hypothetical protein
LRIKKSTFRELTVTVPVKRRGRPSKAVTVATTAQEVATVTVSTPDGFVLSLEGVSAAVQVVQALRAAGGGHVL